LYREFWGDRAWLSVGYEVAILAHVAAVGRGWRGRSLAIVMAELFACIDVCHFLSCMVVWPVMAAGTHRMLRA